MAQKKLHGSGCFFLIKCRNEVGLNSWYFLFHAVVENINCANPFCQNGVECYVNLIIETELLSYFKIELQTEMF